MQGMSLCLMKSCNHLAQHVCPAGLTQVSKERQVTFDQLLTPAPGLNTSDPNTKHLLSLANARCTPYTAERLKSLGADVRYGDESC